MGARIRIAVVGCGYWGPNLVRCFSECPDAEVALACDLDPKRLERIRARFPATATTNDFDAVLRDRSIDAVAIATHASSHAKLATLAMRAGKHVLVEKPLAHSAREAESMLAASEETRRILMVGHTFEYNPAVLKLREIVSGDGFGKVLYLYSRRLNLGRIREDVNVLWNLAPHDVSILLFLLGERPVSVRCFGTSFLQPRIEDVAFVYLEFASGVVAHVHVGWLDPSKVREVTVVGERKMAVYDDVDNEAKLRIYDKGIDTSFRAEGSLLDHTIRLRAGDIWIPKIESSEPLKVECQHFVECIRSGTTPRTDGRNGLEVTRILEAANRSLQSGGEKVSL